MTSKPVQPGDAPFITNAFTNSITQKTVREVRQDGAIMRGEIWPTPFSLLYDTYELAAKGLLLRAASQVQEQKKKVRAAELALSRLQKRFSHIV